MPWGRYRYLRAPQGYLASGDGFTHRDQLTSQDVKNKVELVDDNMIWDSTAEENFASVCKLLDIYGKAGLVMNPHKFQFAQETVSFAGMEITKNAIRPAREYLFKSNTLYCWSTILQEKLQGGGTTGTRYQSASDMEKLCSSLAVLAENPRKKA